MTPIEPGTLYIVSTPIGNLEDITLRALRTLKEVDLIACEDTRHSLKLLNHYEIKNRLASLYSYNEERSSRQVLHELQNNKSAALISDGGTPCISDPGNKLVNMCLQAGIPIVPVPGPSAFLALLVVSGFRTDSFYFHGFLSPKGGRKSRQLQAMLPEEATHIIYESPHRLVKTVQAISEIFPTNLLCIGKEISKKFEKFYNGTAEEILQSLETDKVAGEYVILIANYKKK
jgi:16S rRNA (cytidine1402-2'-O)-methyltransferase